jgi:hypothetical protein
MKRIGINPFGPLTLSLGCTLALSGTHAFAAQPPTQAEPGATTDVAADMAVDGDRAYSFVDPRTQRITVLLAANDRPSMSISIDQAAGMVDVSATDGKVSRVPIADLADAYAQGDAERRAEFLVSMQRKPGTASHNPAPTAQLASIVKWAAGNVGSREDIVRAAENISGDTRKRAVFDPVQTGTQAPEVVRSLADFVRLWR